MGFLELNAGVVDVEAGRIYRGGRRIDLTSNERALLSRLVAEPGQTVSRDTLLLEVFGYADGTWTRTLDTTMRRLRRKLEGRGGRHLHTQRGTGYRFEAKPPSSAEPFFGRAEALDQMAEALGEGARLLTLVGPAGVGKTRLAEEFAARHAGGFAPGAVAIARLAGVIDRTGLCVEASAALGAPTEDEATLLARLRSEPLLLVLDNFEQLVYAAAATLPRWLEAAPLLRLLVTSRERLGGPMERLFAVDPLSLEASVALLEARGAGAAQGALRALAASLDGLPLALELAAGAAPSSRDRGLSALESALETSWVRLSAEERRVLATLSIFVGGFTAEAVDEVAGPGASASLPLLVDRSLVVDLKGRFDLLSTVRAFAAPHASDEAEAAHGRWALRRAVAFQRSRRGRGEGAAIRQAVKERANLYAAVDRAARWAPELAARLLIASVGQARDVGPLAGHLRRIDALLEGAELGAELRAGLHLARGACRLFVGEPAAAGADLALAGDGGADLLFALSDRRAMESAYEASERVLAPHIAGWRAVGEHALAARAEVRVASARRRRGLWDGLGASLERALHVLRRVGPQSDEARCLRELAGLAESEGRLEDAAHWRREEHSAAQASGSLRRQALACLSSAFLHLRLEAPKAGHAAADQAISLSARVGAEAYLCDALHARARLEIAQGRVRACRGTLAAARRLKWGAFPQLRSVFGHLDAQTQMAMGRPARAAAALRALIEGARVEGRLPFEGRVLSDLAVAAFEAGEASCFDQAEAALAKDLPGLAECLAYRAASSPQPERSALVQRALEALGSEPAPALRRALGRLGGEALPEGGWRPERIVARLLEQGGARPELSTASRQVIRHGDG